MRKSILLVALLLLMFSGSVFASSHDSDSDDMSMGFFPIPKQASRLCPSALMVRDPHCPVTLTNSSSTPMKATP